MELPQAFTDKMRGLFGAEYDAFARGFDLPRHYGVRVNTLKIGVDAFEELFDCLLAPVPWCGEGFYYDAEAFRLSKSPYYAAGLYYLQEPSAMSAASILDVKPGERVLDLCASPGGKTTQLAAAMRNTGVLVTNDATSTRMTALLKNVELMGLRNALVTNETAERLSVRFAGWFDKILVDAPCSGEGMFRKDRDAVLSWDAKKPERLSEIQYTILEDAAKMLRNGGRMVYSTCTFSPEENEKQIRAFLDRHPDFELVRIAHERLGVSPARGDWAADDRLTATARIWPHVQKGEGHFIAMLERTGQAPEAPASESVAAADAKSAALWEAFAKDMLRTAPQGTVAQHKDSLYIPPEGLPKLDGLRIFRGGFPLGMVKNTRFEPSSVLALAVSAKDFTRVLDFAVGSEEVRRFLNGEAFEIDAENGMHAFCVDGYPLGLVKMQNGRLKGRV